MKNTKEFIKIVVPLIIVIGLIVVFIFIPKTKEVSKTEVLFSTFVEIKIQSKYPTRKVEKDISDVFTYAKKIGDDIDFHIQNSYVDRLNKTKSLIIPEKYLYFFKTNFDYISKTEGYFNPFVKNLEKLYNYFKKGSVPPSDDLIKKELDNIWNAKFVLNGNKLNIYGNVSLDFGGSAKGYIVDKIYEKLEVLGYKNFLINAGGDIKVSGDKKQWIIGIQSPVNENDIIASIKIKNSSIVTSGNYERYFVYNGKRYFHILNPFTGKPDSDLASVTVIENSCFIADILSTALFAMGKDKAIEFIKKNHLKAFIVWFDFNKKMYYYDNVGVNLNF